MRIRLVSNAFLYTFQVARKKISVPEEQLAGEKGLYEKTLILCFHFRALRLKCLIFTAKARQVVKGCLEQHSEKKILVGK